MTIDIMALVGQHSSEVIAGVVGGGVAALLAGGARYYNGWYEAGQFRGADFHVAATMSTPIDPGNPAHRGLETAVAAGKTHIQELLWLGGEVALDTLLTNPYVLREVCATMSKARDAGLLIGKLPARAEGPLLKKIQGFHNRIPDNDVVRVFKAYAGTGPDGRVHGISPPTHEHYQGAPHRRVLRAMFVPDRLLETGLPPKEAVHFATAAQGNRYETLAFLIDAHRAAPERFDNCRVYF